MECIPILSGFIVALWLSNMRAQMPHICSYNLASVYNCYQLILASVIEVDSVRTSIATVARAIKLGIILASLCSMSH